MALAGLWENWRSLAGECVRSFAVITTTPNALCAELHDRMPVVLGPQVWPEWLGEEPAEPARLKSLLCPHPAEEMTCWPVSLRVGNVKNNDPSLIEPVALSAWRLIGYPESIVYWLAFFSLPPPRYRIPQSLGATKVTRSSP